jgi:hypothetical protein
MRRAILLALPARALVVASGAGEADAPPPDDRGWSHVGSRGGRSAVYLGAGWVLTANHVGAGDLSLSGVSYPAVPGSGVRLGNPDGLLPQPDLLLFRIDPHPDLPRLPIRSTPPSVATPVVMIGLGLGGGARIHFRELPGWDWAGARAKRWGTNEVVGAPVYELRNDARTRAFASSFTPGGTPHEAQAALADSGGGVFAQEHGRWVLAGVMLSISQYDGQPSRSAVYGNLTYSADLSHYRGEILAVTSSVSAP